jgi:dihydropteroate synthase
VEAGAVLVNDVSGGALDPELWPAVADAGVPYVLTHLQGTPETMQDRPTYTDVVADVHLALGTRLQLAREAGLGDILIDVGFGFGKTLEQNYALLAALDSFHILGAPLLVGVSRKSMVYKALGTGPEEALNGTTALHAWALDRGAHFLRVHDVEAAREVLALFSHFHPAPLPGPWPA